MAHLDARTARRWIEGYTYDHDGELRRSAPIPYLAKADDDGHDGVLDFEQLLTLLLVQAFRQRGLGLPTIKRAAARAQQVYGSPNPFVTKQFRSDGNRVFIDLAVPGQERDLIDVLSDQRQFHAIVEPSLFKDVVFAGNSAGEWWPLGKDHAVVLAPARQFGAPLIASKGIRTEVVASMVAAEGGGAEAITTTADWYCLSLGEVLDAINFEGPWQSKKAA
ncbi:hypothetical protein ACELLULO517_02390 [Acidisoma cellulosilytica]|uniref:DUF433 domain-containing protein n=1 Tax=Acidisoma cellulosilyticum TaxID=2802395 RepID=A0A963YXK2_9PROT|nr:hypothetical protein [Acidisoma cellulosilyticum]MCB8879067.1 hypothetical protein [Acidisoma cellulosilyticum]